MSLVRLNGPVGLNPGTLVPKKYTKVLITYTGSVTIYNYYAVNKLNQDVFVGRVETECDSEGREIRMQYFGVE